MDEREEKVPEEQETQDEQAVRNKKKISGRDIEKYCMFALAGAAALLFILTGSSKALTMAVLLFVWWIIRRYKYSKRRNETMEDHLKRCIIFWVIAVVVNLFTAPFFVGTKGAWRYPIIKKYTSGVYHAVRMPDWFPDKLPDSTSGCRISYLPAMGQGSGYFSVSFTCDPSEAEKWEKFGEENAKYIIPLTDYRNARKDDAALYGTTNRFMPSGYETSPEYAVYSASDGSTDKNLSITYNGTFWYGDEDGAVIYVKDTNLDANHPRTEAVIVNREKGMVQLYSE